MKKSFILGALALACALTPAPTQAQSFLKGLFGKSSSSSSASSSSQTESSSAQSSAQDILGNVLGSVVSGATSGSSSDAAGLINNLLATVTGGATTTKDAMIGTWTYTEPAVQFESENLLAKAGASIAQNKVEEKLAKYYKIVGIKQGTLKFTFQQDGTCTYAIGSKQMSGTWEFDSKTKKVTITTSAGIPVTTYVTVIGQQLSLCFDATKVLTLFTSLSGKLSTLNSTLGTIAQLAGNYDGMKVGFAFKK